METPDIVGEIIRLEGKADIPEAQSSEIRWQAARTIWQALQTRTFRELSDELHTRQARRWSIGYLTRMNKVWDKFGRMFAESGTFPGFKEIYNSPEVQGSDQPRTVTAQTLQGGNGTSGGNRSLNPRQSNGDGAQPAKRGAREWIDDADEAITKLEDYPSFIPLVRRSDIDTLRGLIPRIRRIVAPKRTPYR